MKEIEENTGQGVFRHHELTPGRSPNQRRQFENIWLRTKRHDDKGQVKSGSGGVCYLYFPTKVSAVQRRILASVGVR